MRESGYLGVSGQKSDPAIRSGDLDSYKTDIFPLSDDVFGNLFDVFVHNFH